MQNFTFYLPTKIIFGPGTIDEIGSEAATCGRRAFLVTGKKSSSKTGLIDRVIDLLKEKGLEVVLFDKIEPNPRTTTIDDGVKICRAEDCDFVIGLGGGSPMDAAKGIAGAAAEGLPIWEYISHGQAKVRPLNEALPIIEIPTLAATGSEANGGAVITNWKTHEKATLFHPLLYPKVSIIDPALTVTVPEDYTIDGGVDIIAHVLESFFTGVENTPVQDRYALSVAKTVMEYLPAAIDNPNDINARSQLSWCSTVALSGMVNSGRGGSYPLHVMEHALSGHYDISHGRGLALLLPPLMAYTLPSRPEKFAFMARELFGIDDSGKSDMELGQSAIEKMNEFLKSVGRYLKMADVGIDDDSKFEQMAEDTIRIYSANKKFIYNPKPLYKEDIVEIFRRAS
jgi:alcohol dehydrogenase YqhD (iron-dependent ADH family)